MTQIVVTLENGSNLSLIGNAIKMIKGVKNVFVTQMREDDSVRQDSIRRQVLEDLVGSVSMDMVDTDDDRTKYLLRK